MDKNSVIDYVERLRTKPEHVRRRIALGTTAGVTGVVAVGWFLALVFSGSLSLAPASASTATLATAPGTTQIAAAASQTQSGFQQLLGAVGLANSASSTPSLTIVDTTTATPTADDTNQSGTGGNQSVIPF